MFNSRVAVAPKRTSSDSSADGEQPKDITPSKRVRKNRTNNVGNPGLSLTKNHPAAVIEARRKYAAREYLSQTAQAGAAVSPLAASALGLSQTGDGIWEANGVPDERLYGQNLSKYIDTKLVPKKAESVSPVVRSQKRTQRLRNTGYSDRDNVTFGILIRDPYFKINTSEEGDVHNRMPIGRDQHSGKIINPLAQLTSHHFGAQADLLKTINGIEEGAFPTTKGAPTKISNITGAINRGLRGYSQRFNRSLAIDPSGKRTSFFQGFTNLANNIQNATNPYDRTELAPPSQDQMSKAKDLVRSQRPEFFDASGDYINSDVAKQINDAVTRHVIDRNNKIQLQQHRDEYGGLIRALKNVAPCPCPHCQISNYENPLATVLDSSLHHEVRDSDDQILKGVFKKHFGFGNPHAIMMNDPETVYTREDGKKGGGHPHPLSTNIVRQILHKRLKMRD